MNKTVELVRDLFSYDECNSWLEDRIGVYNYRHRKVVNTGGEMEYWRNLCKCRRELFALRRQNEEGGNR